MLNIFAATIVVALGLLGLIIGVPRLVEAESA